MNRQSAYRTRYVCLACSRAIFLLLLMIMSGLYIRTLFNVPSHTGGDVCSNDDWVDFSKVCYIATGISDNYDNATHTCSSMNADIPPLEAMHVSILTVLFGEEFWLSRNSTVIAHQPVNIDTVVEKRGDMAIFTELIAQGYACYKASHGAIVISECDSLLPIICARQYYLK